MQSPFADQELIIESLPADKNDRTSPFEAVAPTPTPLKLPPDNIDKCIDFNNKSTRNLELFDLPH